MGIEPTNKGFADLFAYRYIADYKEVSCTSDLPWDRIGTKMNQLQGFLVLDTNSQISILPCFLTLSVNRQAESYRCDWLLSLSGGAL